MKVARPWNASFPIMGRIGVTSLPTLASVHLGRFARSSEKPPVWLARSTDQPHKFAPHQMENQ